MRERQRIGDMLIEAGLIDESQLGAALGRQRQWGGRVGANLVLMGFITEEQLVVFLSKRLGVPVVDLSERRAEPEALKLLKESVARQYGVLPLAARSQGGKDLLEVALGDPTNIEAVDAVAAVTRRRVVPFVTAERDVLSAIDYYYQGVGHKPVSRGPLTPPPMESVALVRPGDEAVFDLDGERISQYGGSATPREPAAPEPPPVPAGAKHAASATAGAAPGAERPGGGQAKAAMSPEELTRSVRETRVMLVVLAEMLMEAGVVDQDEFYRRFDLKKIVC